MPQFLGKIIFLENYDMRLASKLIAGVDIWMNTPTRPLEASGTSGEKAEMNGVLNLSVLDGWWYEGYRAGAGWALTDKRTFADNALQDKLDATTIYDLIEREIAPLYFEERGEKPYSDAWMQTVKNSLNFIAPHYTMRRMMDDYFSRFYAKLAERSARLHADSYAIASELVAWKHEVAQHWEDLSVLSLEDSFVQGAHLVGNKEKVRIRLSKGGLSCELAVELVIAERNEDGQLKLVACKPLSLVSSVNGVEEYALELKATHPGRNLYSLRILPQHPQLPHRQDFAYVRWVALAN